MKKIVTYFTENYVAANLLMISIMVAGFTSILFKVNREVFPEYDQGMISISMSYRGATPEEVEQDIVIKIEEAVSGVDGIDKITSSSNEGIGSVTVKLIDGYDPQRAVSDIKSAVDAINTFPVDTERAVIKELVRRRHVINVAISGNVSEHELARVTNLVKDDITSIPGITQVDISGLRAYEISIYVSKDNLKRYNISLKDIETAVKRNSLDLPSGSIKSKDGDILIRVTEQSRSKKDFENIPVISSSTSRTVLLKDMAKIVDGFEDSDYLAQFDSQKTSLISVYRVGDQDALEVAKKIKEYIKVADKKYPEEFNFTIWRDRTSILKSRLYLLIKNGTASLFLVFLTLTLFLKFRLAVWVSLGIFVSFLGSMMMMPYFDASINMITLFAFIIALGIVVDDALVISENVYFYQQRDGGPSIETSVKGTVKVATPVIFGVLTTVAAFAPLLFVEGNMGKIMRFIPIIVIPILCFSLIESLLTLPSHLAHMRKKPELKFLQFIEARLYPLLDLLIEKTYKPFMQIALGYRLITFSVFVTFLIISVGAIASGHLKFVFFPKIESDNVIIRLTMPTGTPFETTYSIINDIEKKSVEVLNSLSEKESVKGSPVYEHIMTQVGDFSGSEGPGSSKTVTNPLSHKAEVNIQLIPSEERNARSSKIEAMIREKIGIIPDAVDLNVKSSLFQTGEPINVRLSGQNVERLIEAAKKLKEKLATYAGVIDISDTYRLGKRELKIKIKPEAENRGITVADFASQIRGGFYGLEAQRVQRDRDEARVMIKYPEDGRKLVEDLRNSPIKLSNGTQVPLYTVADIYAGRGYASIARTNRQRSINVLADINPAKANADIINKDLIENYMPELTKEFPEISYGLEGEQEERGKSISSLVVGFFNALFVIYALIAVPLRSFWQPFIIMAVIPFSIIGAVIGHLVLGHDFSFMSFLGVVALSGVAVNSNIIIIDFFNKKVRSGADPREAVLSVASERFRPIVLTAMTTFMGVAPIIMERATQAQFLIPMAISLGIGILFATFISLVLTPVIIVLIEDVKDFFLRVFSRKSEEVDFFK